MDPNIICVENAVLLKLKGLFGIAVAVVVVILKKLFKKKHFLLRLVWKNMCLVKTVVEIEVEQKAVYSVW